MPVLVQKKRVDPKLELELLSKLDQLQQEYLWISDNEQKLKKNHLNKYIAVKNKKVVFDSDDFEALMKVLMLHDDVDSFAIKHITKKPACLLL